MYKVHRGRVKVHRGHRGVVTVKVHRGVLTGVIMRVMSGGASQVWPVARARGVW